MSALDLLRSMRARLATPERWTKEKNARNAVGEGTTSTSPDAVCWCLYGALRCALPRIPTLADYSLEQDAEDLISQAMRDYPQTPTLRGISYFNDHADTKHTDVLAVLDIAIAKAEVTS